MLFVRRHERKTVNNCKISVVPLPYTTLQVSQTKQWYGMLAQHIPKYDLTILKLYIEAFTLRATRTERNDEPHGHEKTAANVLQR
jgi:hypothetical protein